ncbi:hypothetical protein K8R30_02880 [archaeon]|nr:hypothetical protein [archaeon]
MGMSRVWGVVLFLVVLVFAQGVLAIDATHVISNSEDWEDVYSAMLYASLSGVESDFLTSTSHGPVLLDAISKEKSIEVISSKDSPFVFNYENEILSRDYAGASERVVESANLELVEDLDVRNYIVVGNSYGYSAIAVTPYAVLTDSWVFLADRVNIAEIDEIISRRGVGDIIIYGYVEREILDALEKYDPVVIDSGDRFQDNIEIVKMYKEISNAKQILLSNGEFIEREIMLGIHPILFTGRDNVPDQIGEYLKGSDITVGVLIGNDLINAATNIRRTTGLSVMVKFAQGARGQTSGVSAVEGLDLFYLPTPTLDLEVYSIKYNKASSQIEITYHSKSNVPIYVKGTVTIISDGDNERVGDMEPVFIAPSDYKTLTYPDIVIEGGELRADVFTLFGEVASSLDMKLEGSFDLGIINVIDRCEVEVNYVKYNKQAEVFYVGVKNLEDVDCYVDVELRDVLKSGRRQTIGTEGSVLVRGGKKMKIEIDERMDDGDLEDNPFVNVVAYYGEREEVLVKVFRGKFDLDIDMFTGMTYLIVLVVILLIVVLLVLWKKKRDDEW